MNAATFLRQGGLYTVVLGGGSIAMTYLFPAVLRPIAVGMLMAVGVFLFGWALVSEEGPKAGGIQLVRDSDGTKAGPGMRPTGPPALFYAGGLLVFGAVALVMLL